ncbi:hypothetical protein GEMRC1_002818 [Eukaryota sp. GEM-RC1]
MNGIYNSSSGHAVFIVHPRLQHFSTDFFQFEEKGYALNDTYGTIETFLTVSGYDRTPCLLFCEMSFEPFDGDISETNLPSITASATIVNLSLSYNPQLCPNYQLLLPYSDLSLAGVDLIARNSRLFVYSSLCLLSSLLIMSKSLLLGTIHRWLPHYHRFGAFFGRNLAHRSTVDATTDITAYLFGHPPPITSFCFVSIDFCIFIFNLTWALVLDTQSTVILGLSGLLLFLSLIYLDKNSVVARARNRSRIDRSVSVIIPIAAVSLFLFASGLAVVVLLAASHVFVIMFVEIVFVRRGETPCLFINLLGGAGRIIVPGYFLLYSDNFLISEPSPLTFYIMCGIVLFGILLCSLVNVKNSFLAKIFKQCSTSYDPLHLPLEIYEKIKNSREDDSINCTICLEEITITDLENSTYVMTRCNHLYHRTCLTRYANESSNSICPICRQPL